MELPSYKEIIATRNALTKKTAVLLAPFTNEITLELLNNQLMPLIGSLVNDNTNSVVLTFVSSSDEKNPNSPPLVNFIGFVQKEAEGVEVYLGEKPTKSDPITWTLKLNRLSKITHDEESPIGRPRFHLTGEGADQPEEEISLPIDSLLLHQVT